LLFNGLDSFESFPYSEIDSAVLYEFYLQLTVSQTLLAVIKFVKALCIRLICSFPHFLTFIPI